jgi:transcriptional regulator with XRE-family HTH domain
MGSALRDARKARGLLLGDLAEQLGRQAAHVSQFEQGWGRTDARFLDRWAAELGHRWVLVPVEEDGERHIGRDFVPDTAKTERQAP